MKLKRVIAGVLLSCTMCVSLSSCIKPYDKPELVTIEASQTAFLIPLVGDTENQASFKSQELLANAMVATKEIQIPHRWVQTGRLDGDGEWRPSAKLIIVERTPETREWSSSKEVGTSSKNQAIYAESSESIGFSVGMNCSAQIYSEDDAVKFLYSYNNKSLADIMDSEIRARVESKFVEECAKYKLDELLKNKELVMETVRKDVVSYFEEKGITITVLGMKDGFCYSDSNIQESINKKFSSAQEVVAQNNKNEVTISKAEAEAEAKLIEARAEAEANKLISESLTKELIEKQKYEKWDGKLPQISSSATPIVEIN